MSVAATAEAGMETTATSAPDVNNIPEKLSDIRQLVRSTEKHITELFHAGAEPEKMISLRGELVDNILRARWQHHIGDEPGLGLFAVGGYGRNELLPGSDVDILVLLEQQETAEQAEKLQNFLTELWDISLEVGHSVRTLQECADEAINDITVITSMIEARQLTGDARLSEQLDEQLAPDNLWPSADFFNAKLDEQLKRHNKFDNTAYNLEPNVKESPGALRDLQTVLWVAKRHYDVSTISDLVDEHYMTEFEAERLLQAQKFLWRVRIALHVISGRREDRLMFDLQPRVAKALRYADGDNNLAVEHFMQEYFRSVMLISRLNDMLMQLMREQIFPDNDLPCIINDNFQSRGDYLETRSSDLFYRLPSAIMEVFVVMARNPELKGLTADTIRQVRHYRSLIDDDFRRSADVKRLFMQLIRSPQGQTGEFRRMNRYGVLARYIPEFGQIVGLMQFDMFHAYTVDQHTLFVLRNARRLLISEHNDELPHPSEIAQQQKKPWLLYLAALFHDIGKGRGGDHSEVGAVDALDFCLQHGLSQYESELVAWLVKSHLTMSFFSQKRDISDPDVVKEFAEKVVTQERLNFLYLLTTSDMRGTNPKLWTAWKGSLLRQLYRATSDVLARGISAPLLTEDLAEETRELASDISKLPLSKLEYIWQSFGEDYFRRYTADEVAWHATEINAASKNGIVGLPVVAIRPVNDGYSLFVYTQDKDFLFSLMAAEVDRMSLNIEDARLSVSRDGLTVNTLALTEESSLPSTLDERLHEIAFVMTKSMQNAMHIENAVLPKVTRRIDRQLKAFDTPTQITFIEQDDCTLLELVTGDRPGLLATIADVLTDCGVVIINALINTIGERAEDVFYLQNADYRPLTKSLQAEVEETLVETLDATMPTGNDFIV